MLVKGGVIAPTSIQDPGPPALISCLDFGMCASHSVECREHRFRKIVTPKPQTLDLKL